MEVEGAAAELADAVAALLRSPDERGQRRAQTLLRKALIRGNRGSENRGLQDYIVVSPGGRVLSSSGEGLAGKIFSEPLDGVVAKALVGRTAVTAGNDLVPRFQEEKSSPVRMVAATPIPNADGDTIAVLVLRRPLSLDARRRDGAGSAYGTIRASFFDGSGRRLEGARSEARPAAGVETSADLETPLLPSALRNEGQALGAEGVRVDTAGYPGPNGGRVVGAAAYFPDLHVGLIAEIDFHRAYRPVERLGRTMALVNLAAALFGYCSG